MLLQLPAGVFSALGICLVAVFILAVGTGCCLLVLQERARLAAPPPPPPLAAEGLASLAAPSAGGSWGLKWRKAAPCLLFLGLGVLFVALRPVLPHLLTLGQPVVAPDALNAEGAQVVANEVSGGYVQLGTATSKLVMMVAIYALFSFVPWVFQQLTHPGPTRWKKECYTSDFDALPALTKFEIDGRLGLNAAIRVLAAVTGACLIQ